MTDGRAIAYSEREREFTFANKSGHPSSIQVQRKTGKFTGERPTFYRCATLTQPSWFVTVLWCSFASIKKVLDYWLFA